MIYLLQLLQLFSDILDEPRLLDGQSFETQSNFFEL